MEWKFCINWPALIEEAKSRRKQQKLTQARLAQLAGVSTPTLSRFENGEEDIQLSSALKILAMLGMIDKRTLVFTCTTEKYDSIKMVVTFNGKENNKTIQCAISKEALDDYFGDIHNPLKAFKANREQIYQLARRKYLAKQLEPDGSILVKTTDLE